MESVEDHISQYLNWITVTFANVQLALDHTFESIQLLDLFFERYSADGQPTQGSILQQHPDNILYGMGIYFGETMKLLLPEADWEIVRWNDKDALTGTMVLEDGKEIFPMERVVNRFQHGAEYSIYKYAVEVRKSTVKGVWWKFWK